MKGATGKQSSEAPTDAHSLFLICHKSLKIPISPGSRMTENIPKNLFYIMVIGYNEQR